MHSYTLTAIPKCLSGRVSRPVYTARPISKLRDSLRGEVEHSSFDNQPSAINN